MTRKFITFAIVLASIAFATSALAAPLPMGFAQLLPADSHTTEALPNDLTTSPTLAALGSKAPLGTDFLTFLRAGEIAPLVTPGCVEACHNQRRRCLTRTCSFMDPDYDNCVIGCFAAFEICTDNCICQ